MTDQVTIDVPRVRAAGHALRGSVELLDASARAVASCGFAVTPSGAVDPAREHAIRDGYLRLARAIGGWAAASDTTGRALAATADTYRQQDVAAAGTVVALGGR
ncbi:N-acyl-D-amino-acid deacylase [Prescottella subtropica]|uniref:N-acyl-D-amino-acid deacylase n=1 Tax=Prescottella subtropica TaxID=2545757 RepID=UPI0010F7E50D|nr:N-acyl-D-amino-acid deacylase [Prescottella subtropica]